MSKNIDQSPLPRDPNYLELIDSITTADWNATQAIWSVLFNHYSAGDYNSRVMSEISSIFFVAEIINHLRSAQDNTASIEDVEEIFENLNYHLRHTKDLPDFHSRIFPTLTEVVENFLNGDQELHSLWSVRVLLDIIR